MDKNETIINNLREFIEVLDNQIDALNENLPTQKKNVFKRTVQQWHIRKFFGL